MTRINLQDINANEFALVYNWRLNLKALPVGLQTLTGIPADAIGENGMLNVNCTSAGIPKSIIRPVNPMIRGMQTIQSGGRTAEQSIDLTFVERRDWSISRFFETWKTYIFDMAAGTGNSKVNYISTDGNFRLELLTETYDADIQATYVLQYAFPSAVSYTALGSNVGEVATTSVTMSFATFTIEY